MDTSIEALQSEFREFADRREWGEFHTSKNLVMALVGEVGELVEIFQWLTPEQSADVMSSEQNGDHVREELADVFGYLIRLSDVLNVDLVAALEEKIRANESKYPAEKARGNAKKYTDLI
jgi:dCTP diphosphatase